MSRIPELQVDQAYLHKLEQMVDIYLEKKEGVGREKDWNESTKVLGSFLIYWQKHNKS